MLYHTPLFYLIQSVWRDEAFSYFMAKPDILKIVSNTANDFNPPLYYILLHFWMNITGKSDELLRVLSFIPHIITVYIAYLFARKIFSARFAVFVAFFTLINPMLLYYAFEIRMYSFYALFTICSFYFMFLRKWKYYIILSVLGLYTHSFFPLVIFSYLFCFLIVKKINKKDILFLLSPFLFYIPWIPFIFIQFLKSGNSWLFPVDMQLIKSVLGNLFIFYEGTPGHLWQNTGILSGFILLFILMGLRVKKDLGLIILASIFLPLLLILSYSVLKRPLYVNRYMIFVTVFEILGISLGIWSISNKIVRSSIAVLWFILVLIFNFYITPFHKKTDFKSVFIEINQLSKPDDYVFTKTPIGFLESAYYYKNQNKVFVYNPNNIKIPDYIGVNVVFPQVSRASFPPSPSRTFLVSDDANYDTVIYR